ncbi:MAG: hypothetical protein HOV81_37880 [Kofleriaceae bacterium]|nr:hypothetical protein [Kofleriaceae bacterium]
MRIASLIVPACLALAACGDTIDYDEPQDAVDDGGKADAPAQSCTKVRCGNPDADHILFPGNPACSSAGCERGLAADDLYIPPTNGRPWGDTYERGVIPATTLAGYSSGRIALLRRLALVGDGEHAVLLDPSWPDGARNFLGDGPVRGEDIIEAWLEADEARTFTLIYSTRSVGWSNYVALQKRAVGDRVKVCKVTEPHMLVPKVRGIHDALVDPVAWDNGTCTWGTGG